MPPVHSSPSLHFLPLKSAVAHSSPCEHPALAFSMHHFHVRGPFWSAGIANKQLGIETSTSLTSADSSNLFSTTAEKSEKLRCCVSVNNFNRSSRFSLFAVS